jgi:hypothetical protein
MRTIYAKILTWFPLTLVVCPAWLRGYAGPLSRARSPPRLAHGSDE